MKHPYSIFLFTYLVIQIGIYPSNAYAVHLNEPVHVKYGRLSTDGVVTRVDGDQVTVHYKTKDGKFESVTLSASKLEAAKNPDEAIIYEEERSSLEDGTFTRRNYYSESLRKRYGLTEKQTINPDGSNVRPGAINHIGKEYKLYASYLKDLDQYKLSPNEKEYWSDYYKAVLYDLKQQAKQKDVYVSEPSVAVTGFTQPKDHLDSFYYDAANELKSKLRRQFGLQPEQLFPVTSMEDQGIARKGRVETVAGEYSRITEQAKKVAADPSLSETQKNYWASYYSEVKKYLQTEADRRGIPKPQDEVKPAEARIPPSLPVRVESLQAHRDSGHKFFEDHGLLTTKEDFARMKGKLEQSPVGTYIFRVFANQSGLMVMHQKVEGGMRQVLFKIVGDQVVRVGADLKEIEGSKVSLEEFLKDNIPENALSLGQHLASEKLVEEGLYVPFEKRKTYENQNKRFSNSYSISPHPKLPGVMFLQKIGDPSFSHLAFVALPDGRIKEAQLGVENKKVIVRNLLGEPLTVDEWKDQYLAGVNENEYVLKRSLASTKSDNPCPKIRPLSAEKKAIHDLKGAVAKTPSHESEIEAALRKVFTYHDPSLEYFPPKARAAYQKVLEDSKNVEVVVDEMVANYLHLYITRQITPENEPKPHKPMLDRIMAALPAELKAVGKGKIEEIAFNSYLYHGIKGLYAHRNQRDDLRGSDGAAAISENSEDMKQFKTMIQGALDKDFRGGKKRTSAEISEAIQIKALEIEIERAQVYTELEETNLKFNLNKATPEESVERRRKKLEGLQKKIQKRESRGVINSFDVD
jgi:hypothetical protein